MRKSGGGKKGKQKFRQEKAQINAALTQHRIQSALDAQREEEVEEPPPPRRRTTIDRSNFGFLNKHHPPQYLYSNPETFRLNRTFRVKLDYVRAPEGSARLYQGETCMLTAVIGPTEIARSRELPHRAVVNICLRSKVTGAAGRNAFAEMQSKDRNIEQRLTKIFESVLFLQNELMQAYNIIFHEIEDDGCLFSACVNSASLALMNAGSPMRYMVAGVSVLVNEEKRILIVDPSSSQTKEGYDGIATFVYSNTGHVLYSKIEGMMSKESFSMCLGSARKAAEEIFEFFRQVQQDECMEFKYKTRYCYVKKGSGKLIRPSAKQKQGKQKAKGNTSTEAIVISD